MHIKERQIGCWGATVIIKLKQKVPKARLSYPITKFSEAMKVNRKVG